MTPDLPVALDAHQQATLDAYVAELERVNRRVNLVARPATHADLERHVHHCLALAVRAFPDGAVVVDWGTGGGLPAIPLAVAFPEVRVVAVDAVGKKTEAVRLFARRLEIDNLETWNGRAEAYDGPAPHYAVSRATAPLADLWRWFEAVRAPLADVPEPAPDPRFRGEAGDVWTPGLVCLKGGDLTVEIADLRRQSPEVSVETLGLADVLGDEWADKTLVHVTDRP